MVLLLKRLRTDRAGKEGRWLKTTLKINLKTKQAAARRRNPRPADFRETFAD
jgi:hypothetical protein